MKTSSQTCYVFEHIAEKLHVSPSEQYIREYKMRVHDA